MTAFAEKPYFRHLRLFRWILIALTLLLVFQYIRNRSLWLDEAMLSLNIIDRSYAGLLQPLDYVQVAPVLFLLIEKTFTLLTGNSEWGLRAFPLLCAIASLDIFFHLTATLFNQERKATDKRPLDGALVGLVGLCLLGLTPKFIYYGSEVKQYAVDLLVLLSIYFTAFGDAPLLSRKRRLILSIVLATSIFLSNISVVPLAAIGGYYAFEMLRRRKIDWDYIIPLAIGGLAFSMNYALFIMHHPAAAAMKEFWRDAFMPLNPLDPKFRIWVGRTSRQLFQELMPFPVYPKLYLLTIALYLASLAHMFIAERFKLLYLCLAPVIIHIGLSALKLYPFDLRLVLYQLPLYLLAISYGMVTFTSLLIRSPGGVYATLIIGIGIFSFRLVKLYPMQAEEIKVVLKQVNDNIQPGQKIYIYYPTAPAVHYYEQIGFAQFRGDSTFVGKSRVAAHVTNDEEYVDEIRDWHGPTWLLFSHVYPFDGSRGEERYIIKRLSERGAILKQFESTGSSAYLMDLR